MKENFKMKFVFIILLDVRFLLVNDALIKMFTAVQVWMLFHTEVMEIKVPLQHFAQKEKKMNV